MKLKAIVNTMCSVALVGGAASAQQSIKEDFGLQDVVPGEQVYAGSDTFNLVMDILLNADGVAGNGELAGLSGATGGPGGDEGINPNYQGVGSSAGERYMVGQAGSNTPVCTLAPGSTVMPGCQEVTAMSRAQGSRICDQAEWDSTSNPNTVGEGLAVANDGLVLITDNASYQDYSIGACTSVDPTPNDAVAADYTLAAPDSGRLASSGTIPGTSYTLGAGGLAGSAWQDVIRLVYTGCEQDDGDCTTTVANSDRCDSDVRNALVDNWGAMFEGSDCGTGTCTELRQAYRRDDASGTTGVFLSTIGVDDADFDSTNFRATVGLNGFFGINAASEAHPFCDGFQFEGVLPGGGDPITRDCAEEDDICNSDGTMGIVRAIISTPNSSLDYPTVQCTRGAFALVPFFASGFGVCPDGNAPVGGSFCNMPFYDEGDADPDTRDFNCMNPAGSLPPGAVVGQFDGRVYNAYVSTSDGETQLLGPSLPVQANWRQNMVDLTKGNVFFPFDGPYDPADTVCQLDDATQNIGCLVGNTTCTFGYAGRETAALTAAVQSSNGTDPGGIVDLSLNNEAMLVNGFGPTNADISSLDFPFARELFFNSDAGFEVLTSSCLAAGRTDSFCDDEFILALSFYNNVSEVQAAFATAGFIPKSDSVCRGAENTAGCGLVNDAVDSAGRPQMANKAECCPDGSGLCVN